MGEMEKDFQRILAAMRERYPGNTFTIEAVIDHAILFVDLKNQDLLEYRAALRKYLVKERDKMLGEVFG